MVLQKDAENDIDGVYEPWGSFKQNRNKGELKCPGHILSKEGLENSTLIRHIEGKGDKGK